MRRYFAFVCFAGALCAQNAPFDVHAMLRLARISDPQISPDGKLVSFGVQRVDVEKNTRPRQIYVVPTGGGTPKPIGPEEANNDRARWFPDSKRIAFISDKGGSSQVWTMDPDGVNAKALTGISTEAGGVLVSPDGKNLVFTSDVFPDCADDACNKQKLEADKASKVKARIYDGLLYRHWTHWQSRQRSHLFVVPAGGGTPKDLTPGPRDVPPFSMGGEDYAIAPDGQEVCFVMNGDDVAATSTNSDLYVVPIEGGPAKKITVNPAADNNPQYSPDGKFIAYRSQVRAGYESDRWRLTTLERATGKVTILTEALDRWVNGFTWSPDSSRLFFTADDRGRQAIQFILATGGAIRMAVSGASHLDDIQFTADGKTMVYSQQSGSAPVEIYQASSSGGSAIALTHLNDAVLSGYSLPALESFWAEGAEKARVQGFLVKPPNFDPKKKYPALMLIHGGPQGAWGESWSYRWNAQVFAAAGYVVAMPNPRGSTGYGQRFTDEINQDWGGKAFDDIMAAADYLAALPYVDKDRMAAAGGSYGGYMVDWILGHSSRFKALVSHAGVYDLRSEAGETEELWFPFWEFGGTPWDNPDVYARWSPSNFVKEFRTPTLVIHGELDFRVPYGQGLQLFTALQMQKVPSRLLVYPDEGHWVLKPQNSVLWYKTFIEWIDQWTKR
jgi:dipeptidyl aminopeptidase/acylaminoacyl peptidase